MRSANSELAVSFIGSDSEIVTSGSVRFARVTIDIKIGAPSVRSARHIVLEIRLNMVIIGIVVCIYFIYSTSLGGCQDVLSVGHTTHTCRVGCGVCIIGLEYVSLGSAAIAGGQRKLGAEIEEVSILIVITLILVLKRA